MAVQSYKDLIVGQKAICLVTDVYRWYLQSVQKEKLLDALTEVDRMLSGLVSSLTT